MEYTPGREYGTAIPHTPYSSRVNRHTASVTVVIANLTLTGGMIWLRADSAPEVIAYIGYFVASTSLFQLIDSEQLVEIVRILADARTQRQRDKLTYTVHKPHVDLLPEPRRPATLVAPSYVAPVDDSTRREAMAWLVQLYDDRGQPDSRKVLLSTAKERPGRIRIKAPSDQATEYLVQRGVLRVRVKDGQRNGYALNMRYSLRDDALQVL